jgi:ABC-type antimicrobial peptide transport system permease subunit
MQTVIQDLQYGLRMLAKNPGFTVVAVLTLALCIGANLTIFAVVEAILLRPLPFPQPERLVTMFNTYPKTDIGRAGSSFPNVYNRRGTIEAFSSVAAYKNDAVIVGEAGGASRVEIMRVSPEFFETLGVGLAQGRSFAEEEMTVQTHHVAILSHAYWRRHFDADADILGREVRVNGFAKMIVGVLPPGFRFLSSKAQIFLPLSSSLDQRGINSLHNSSDCEMIARLKPGATLAEAQAQIDANNTVAEQDFPYAKQVEASGFRTIMAPLHADHVAGIRPTLLLLQAGGLFLLLIGAVNLANLLLVRASARTKELAIRQSLGASRLQVVRQAMTVANRPVALGELPLAPYIYGVAGDYFRAMGIPLRAGRFFDGSESRRNERVCIVDEIFSRRNWPAVNAVGQLVYDSAEVKEGDLPFTVIGVVGAVKQTELTEQRVDGAIYFPLRDHPLVADNLYVVVRTGQRPEAVRPALEKVVREIEPELPINDLRTMETRIADTLVMRRSPMLLASVFAVVALLLAAIGTYGVLSFALAQRRREIGVRMALGALPRQIGRQFLTLGLRLLLVGTILGLFGAWLAGRAMQSILFNVPPLHIATLLGTALILGAVSLVACLLPALRASRVDPMEALRHE